MASSIDRSKKKLHLWKKAIIHFSLCFLMGFFTGFAPSTTSLFSPYNNIPSNTTTASVINRSLMAQIPSNSTPTIPQIQIQDENNEKNYDTKYGAGGDMMTLLFQQHHQLIIITTTRSQDPLQGPLLRRLAQTLRLVPAPVLWIVVQGRDEAAGTAGLLRSTGVMYRHLTHRENFTDTESEAEHQRNLGLTHVEHHRLQGIVHFADSSNVYDLNFFDEIRHIELIGAWPVAMVSSNRKRVLLDGPLCRSSKIVGWSLKDLNDESSNAVNAINNAEVNSKPSKINVSGFAFNSSILWDPNRWGRPTAQPDTSQDSYNFVQEVLRDESKVKGIPSDCNKIMLWNVYIPRTIALYKR